MRLSGSATRAVAPFGAVVLCVLLATAAFAEKSTDGAEVKANLLTNVTPYPRDDLSGSMAIHALNSALRSVGVPCYYQAVVAVSGAAFGFVYDSTEAYEPLRDAFPIDILANAAARNGYTEAHWETDLTLEEVRRIIKREIDSGHPLISPFLKPDEYHGLNVITGYDYDKGMLHIQGAFDQRRSITIPIPDGWDGPTVSPAGWASNPLFVLGEAFDDSLDEKVLYSAMVDEAIMLLQGGTLEYGLHPGEWQYMSSRGPHTARYGLPAYEILTADVEDADVVVERDGREMLNFGLVWRIDAMLGLLAHNRTHAHRFATLLRGLLLKRQASVVFEMATNLERTVADAADLRDIFWHEVPESLVTAGDVLAYVKDSEAIIFRLPEQEGLTESLRNRGRAVYDTPWGAAVVEDSPERRLGAKLKVISIASRERRSLDLLEETAERIRQQARMRQSPDRQDSELRQE